LNKPTVLVRHPDGLAIAVKDADLQTMCTLIEVKTAKIILLREASRLVVHLNACTLNGETIDLAACPGIVDIVVGITVSKREGPV
jgi:hypothetical protein